MRLTAKDKRVINDFIDRKSIGSHSRRLWTDGHVLGTHGLGGGPLARWSNNDTIEFNDRGTVSEQTIRRYILKIIPPRWVASDSQWVLPTRRRPASKRRDPSARKSRREPGRDPQPNINPVCPVGTEVQTVILSKNFFNQREAKSWIGRHDFRISKIDETANSWRFRQQPPDWFEKRSFRTIRLRPGVEAVIGCPLD